MEINGQEPGLIHLSRLGRTWHYLPDLTFRPSQDTASGKGTTSEGSARGSNSTQDGETKPQPSTTRWNRFGSLPHFGTKSGPLRGAALNWGIGIIASYGFLMFGYDQGVLSGLLTLDDFQRDQTLMTPLDDSNLLCWTAEGPPN